MASESPASNTNVPNADPPARDLSGGVDTSGFVGVDPMYQNYSTDTGKPLNTKDEQKAIKSQDWGSTGATAVTEGDGPAPDENILKAKTNDEGQVVTEGGDGGFAAGATTVAVAEEEAPVKEEKASSTKTPAKE